MTFYKDDISFNPHEWGEEDNYQRQVAHPKITDICKGVQRRILELTNYVKEFEMLPDNMGEAPSRGKRSTAKVPYIGVEDLDTTPREAKILAVRANPNGRYGGQVIVKIAIAGKAMMWGVSLKNPNYDLLLKKFGRGENDWINQKIYLHNELDDFSENYNIRVSFGEDDSQSTRTTTRRRQNADRD